MSDEMPATPRIVRLAPSDPGVLAARDITITLPASLERRILNAGRRIERDERRLDLDAEDRIDAVRDFEHVLLAMLDLGLETSETEDGLQADPVTGRLSVYPPQGTRSISPPRSERGRDSLYGRIETLTLLAALATFAVLLVRFFIDGIVS